MDAPVLRRLCATGSKADTNIIGVFVDNPYSCSTDTFRKTYERPVNGCPLKAECGMSCFPRQLYAGIVIAAAALTASAQVPVPSAKFLPVTGGSAETRSVPFLTQANYLVDRGYTETEYLVSGKASVYDYVNNAARSPVVEVVRPDIPYTTRMIVRRPVDPHKFRGTVYFDVLNATRGYDGDIVWYYSRNMIMDQGAVYVGLTSKTNTVDFLRDRFGRPPYLPRNASRYSTLSMTYDGQVWDMLSQAAALLKDDANPDNPLAGFNVRRIILAGYSQSAGYVKTYINSFHRDAVLADGRPAFDGYFEGAGSFASKVPNPPTPSQEFNAINDPRNKIILPVPAPVMRFQTQTEITSFFGSRFTRQTEAESPLIRTYEMAGGVHVDARQIRIEAEQNLEELGLVSQWPDCTAEASNLPVEYVHSALLSRLDDWIASSRRPPASRLLSIVQNQSGQDVIETDADGNPVGGVRLPQLAVPTGVWSDASKNIWCLLNGSYVPFDAAELARRYPSRRDYLRKTFAAIVKVRRQGFLLRRNAWEIYADAYYSGIGSRR